VLTGRQQRDGEVDDVRSGRSRDAGGVWRRSGRWSPAAAAAQATTRRSSVDPPAGGRERREPWSGLSGLVVHLGGQPVELHGLGGQHQEPREHGR
jgi:hypothetical protein